MDRHKIIALMRHAYNMPEGKSRTAMMEEAVRGADLINDRELQFQVRLDFIQSASRSDDMPKMMAAVAWCQGVYDESPDQFDLDGMLGAIATAVNCTASIHQITRQQCDDMFADYKQRLQKAGYDLFDYYRIRSYNALWMGDLDIAKEHFHRMIQMGSPQSLWANLFRSDYYLQTGDVPQALAEAEPILKSKGDADGTYHWAASFLLTTMVRRRKRWRASRCQRRSYQLLKGNPDHIELIGHHLLYFAQTKKWKAGAEMLSRHLSWALSAFDHRELFEFYVGGWRFCADAASKKKRLKIDLPPGFPEPIDAGDTQQLANWMEANAKRLAGIFDERNGNSHFSSVMAERISG